MPGSSPALLLRFGEPQTLNSMSAPATRVKQSGSCLFANRPIDDASERGGDGREAERGDCRSVGL